MTTKQLHPHSDHSERHFSATDTVRDIVIGMSDGLTVPFALAAGISGAIAQSHLVLTAGVAELAAGSIAMGLGGYLAAQSESEHFSSEKRREIMETEAFPAEERNEVIKVFENYGLEGQLLEQVADCITADKTRWVDFMMRFELGLEEPDPSKGPLSALRIGGAYIVGGIIPLAPYVWIANAPQALLISSVLTLMGLFVFGAVKGKCTGVPPLPAAFQTVLIGGIAAAMAFFLARAVR